LLCGMSQRSFSVRDGSSIDNALPPPWRRYPPFRVAVVLALVTSVLAGLVTYSLVTYFTDPNSRLPAGVLHFTDVEPNYELAFYCGAVAAVVGYAVVFGLALWRLSPGHSRPGIPWRIF
jgi:hypothetical protein